MNEGKKEFLRSTNWMLTNGRTTVRGLILLFAVPMLVLGIWYEEAGNLRAGWHWRNAQPVTAMITGYEVEQADLRGRVIYDHTIDFTYQAGSEEMSSRVTLQSYDKVAIRDDEINITLWNTGKMPVFYRPEDPRENRVVIDPRTVFWSAAKRLSVFTGVGILMGAMVLLIVAFYRPTSIVKHKFHDKLSISPPPPTDNPGQID
jgi:hypothetical protein